jgi:hypothetical protein
VRGSPRVLGGDRWVILFHRIVRIKSKEIWYFRFTVSILIRYQNVIQMCTSAHHGIRSARTGDRYVRCQGFPWTFRSYQVDFGLSSSELLTGYGFPATRLVAYDPNVDAQGQPGVGPAGCARYRRVPPQYFPLLLLSYRLSPRFLAISGALRFDMQARVSAASCRTIKRDDRVALPKP